MAKKYIRPPAPPANLVREVLDYCPETGIFAYKNPRSEGRKSSHPSGIGGMDGYGYHRIAVGGWQIGGHRLAWAYVHGYWPNEIDHINGDRADNRISNLRECTRKENQRNRAAQRNSTTGAKSVTAIRLKGGATRYRAKIQINGVSVHLGCYEDVDDASFAYSEAAIAAFGAFARTE